MSLLEGNPMYPSGRCDVCGWGLTEAFLCQNSDCQQNGSPGCHIDCGPIVRIHPTQHAHDGGDDGLCWHINPNQSEACIRAVLH